MTTTVVQAVVMALVGLLALFVGRTRNPVHQVIVFALYWRFGQQMAVRVGDWKLVKAGRPRMAPESAQLYNLAEDVGEKTDLAEKHPEKVKELDSAWKKWNAELVKPAWGAPGGGRQPQP